MSPTPSTVSAAAPAPDAADVGGSVSLLPTAVRARPRRSLAAAGGALALLALGTQRVALAGEARAETGPGAQLAGSLWLSYSDGFGPGQLTVDPVGPDEATGGTAVFVHLAQARGPFSGVGFVRPVGPGAYVFAATVAGVAGIPGGSRESYFLAGTVLQSNGGWRGRGRWSAVADPSTSGEWHVAEWPAIEPPRPQLTASVRLEAASGSGVSGSATLVALPEGETRIEVQLQGLTPGETYGLRLRAGTPAQPSASFTHVATVTADAAGRASADGLVRFRGADPIALLDIAGGEHFLSVVGVGAGQEVASGAIPPLQPLG